MKRRDFITGMGTLACAAPVASAMGFYSGLRKVPGAKPALQLYTIRNEISKDIAGSLKRLADIGIKHVETAFWPAGMTVQKAGEYLKQAGLSVTSAHIDLPVGDKAQAMLDTAAALGCKKMIWHGWPEDKRYSSLDGTRELIGLYNEAGKFAAANGLQFGLHNHWWEYRNKVGGKYVYEVLMEELDKNIFFEIDTYWVHVAGLDPAKIVGLMGERAPLLHIKDGPAKWNDSLPQDIPDPMTPVGQGTQNFPAIVKAADGHTEWMVIEMDKTDREVFGAIKESYDYLVRNKLVVV
jgi:sugar phosphate isomerase/epimerase